MFSALRSAVLATTAIVGLTDVGHALVPFAPATYSFSAYAHDRDVYQNERTFVGPVVERGDIWKLGIVGQPIPVISLQQNSVSDPGEIENASYFNGMLRYSFQINAASRTAFDDALATGQLLINGFTDLSTTLSQGYSGRGTISVFSDYDAQGTSTVPFYADIECNEGNIDGCGRHDFFGALSLAQFADEANLSFSGMVWMTAAMIAPRYGFSETSRVIVDPVLSLSGNGLDQSQYTFKLSGGIGNGAAATVPEPASWGLMIFGFGVVGASLRNRRKLDALA
jgi:PEP-CTERM motif